MNERKLGVAIHGAGDVAHAHAMSWRKNPHVEIVSISSRTRASGERLAQSVGVDCLIRTDYTEVLADPDVQIVNISTPNHVHAEQGIAAARAGKHLLIEKPMALTADENRALRDAVVESGVKSVCSFVLRWNPLFTIIKRQLADGTIGELFYAEVDYWHGIGPGRRQFDWFRRKETAGSAMLLAGCHALDALRWFVGDEVVEVSAMSNNKKGHFEYDANVVATLKFRNGVIGKTSCLFDCVMPYAFNIDLAGTEGTIRENRLWAPKALPGQTGWATVPTILPDSGDVHHHPFDAEIDHLVDCIRHDRESHCNVADAYHTHELCLAIDRSLELGGQVVRLPLE
ncbi:MAG: Gfo/Idh/MocA family oxidoreductase [Pirellulales bacterium]|nr:Gfo/Idh/MocA family oxidoreductase [Pirellulales bacterium]